MKLLFIGAGASYGARCTGKEKFSPPLGDNLREFLLRVLHSNGLLIEYHEVFSKKDLVDLENFLNSHSDCTPTYECLVTALINNQPYGFIRILGLLNKLLAFSFSEANRKGGRLGKEFSNRIDLYDKLIQKLNIDRTWKIISLNYDLLFEQALSRAGLEYEYNRGDFTLNSRNVEILKPHGSINWFAPTSGTGRTIQMARRMSRTRGAWDKDLDLPTSESKYIDVCRPQDVLGYLLESNPIMAHYSSQKYSPRNMQRLNDVRDVCVSVCGGTDSTYVLGVRPPSLDTDLAVSQIFNVLSKNDHNLFFINKSGVDCEAVRKMSEVWRPIELGFTEFLLKDFTEF